MAWSVLWVRPAKSFTCLVTLVSHCDLAVSFRTAKGTVLPRLVGVFSSSTAASAFTEPAPLAASAVA
eukprot:9983255-Alexandrium_andersonii.AAC.1